MLRQLRGSNGSGVLRHRSWKGGDGICKCHRLRLGRLSISRFRGGHADDGMRRITCPTGRSRLRGEGGGLLQFRGGFPPGRTTQRHRGPLRIVRPAWKHLPYPSVPDNGLQTTFVALH